MDTDEAWEMFRLSAANRVQKTSIPGQLETIATAVQNLTTDMKALNDIVIPKLTGDQTAIDVSQQQAVPPASDPLGDFVNGGEQPVEPDAGGAEMPPEEGDLMAEEEEDEYASEKTVPVEASADTDSLDRDEADDTALEGDAAMTEGEGDTELGVAETSMGGDSAEAGPGVDDQLTETGGGETPMQSPAPEGTAVDSTTGEPPMTDEAGNPPTDIMDGTGMEGAVPGAEDMGDPLIQAYQAFTDAVREAAHRAVDSGQMDKVNRLADAQATIDAIWGTQICPVADMLGGTDKFVKSAQAPEVLYKRNDIMKSEIEDKPAEDIAPAVEKSCDAEPVEKSDTQMDELTDADEHPHAECEKEQVDELSEPDEHPGAESEPEQLDQLHEAKPGSNSEGKDQMDEVLKTADKHGDGEYEEDMTEFENSGTRVAKSEPYVPSFSEMMRDPIGSYGAALDSIRKSIPDAGAQHAFKGGMGATGLANIVGDGAIRKDAAAYQRIIDNDRKAREGFYDAPQRQGDGSVRADDWYNPNAQPLSDEDPDPVGYSDGASPSNMAEGVGEAPMNDYLDEDGMGPDDDMEYPGQMERPAQTSPMTGGDRRLDSIVRNKPGYFTPSADGSTSSPSPDAVRNRPLTVSERYPPRGIGKSSDMPLENSTNLEASVDVPADETSGAMYKHMPTFDEMMSSRVSKAWAPRPNTTVTFNGSVVRPQLGEVKKSAKPTEKVRMGYGVDPRAVTADLWADYALYKSNREF